MKHYYFTNVDLVQSTLFTGGLEVRTLMHDYGEYSGAKAPQMSFEELEVLR